MAEIKAYTDLSQSKKLAEFLPLESADYCHATDAGIVITAPYITYCGEERCVPAYKGAVPCWSLSALFKLMPKIGAHEPMLCKLYYISEPTERYICQYSLTDMTSEYDNSVDACYEMIIKLHDLNLL